MAGLGGFCGYALGGINWDVTALGKFQSIFELNLNVIDLIY